jgi:hypothetical protein
MESHASRNVSKLVYRTRVRPFKNGRNVILSMPYKVFLKRFKVRTLNLPDKRRFFPYLHDHILNTIYSSGSQFLIAVTHFKQDVHIRDPLSRKYEYSNEIKLHINKWNPFLLLKFSFPFPSAPFTTDTKNMLVAILRKRGFLQVTSPRCGSSTTHDASVHEPNACPSPSEC